MAYQPRESVADFHRHYGVPGICDLSLNDAPDMVQLRIDLIAEEAMELIDELDALKQAFLDGDWREAQECLERVAKESADLKYVTYGTDVALNIPSEPVFDEVHRSNMSKLDGHGKPIYGDNGKVMKGPNYSPADVHGIFVGKVGQDS